MPELTQANASDLRAVSRFVDPKRKLLRSLNTMEIFGA